MPASFIPWKAVPLYAAFHPEQYTSNSKVKIHNLLEKCNLEKQVVWKKCSHLQTGAQQQPV